jgi:DNA-binding CsgD family transcriptional regulator
VAGEFKLFGEIRQLLTAVLVILFEPMSLDPSFHQTKFTSNPAAAFQALLVASPDGRIQFATARADRWMRDFFAAVASPQGRLPEALTRWLDHGASGGYPARFIIDRPGRRLCVQLLCREADSVCLLLERNPEISPTLDAHGLLTERQTEVLSWVARGKTNAEIGKILSLKTKTIGKYLERIFPKLGVENRTAAASFVLGVNRAS